MGKPKSIRYKVLDTEEVFRYIGKRASWSIISQVDNKLDPYTRILIHEKLVRHAVFDELRERLRK